MEQRRTRRFQLQLPLSITRTGAARVAFPGKTKNISSSGVLFTTELEPDLSGGSIEYVITLNHEGPQMVNLRCIGKVLRCMREEDGYADAPTPFVVAATLERYEFVRA
jgi:hypothetical protein